MIRITHKVRDIKQGESVVSVSADVPAELADEFLQEIIKKIDLDGITIVTLEVTLTALQSITKKKNAKRKEAQL